MGSGKTTLGAKVAQALRHEFFDLDRVIEAQEGLTVAQIFATRGEAAFRKAEGTALESLLGGAKSPRVVALGGGAFLQPAVREIIRKYRATTIFLDAPPEELYQRCVDSLDATPRPLLKDLPSFRKLYSERLPLYREADVHVSTTGDVREVVVKIQDLVMRAAGPAPQRNRP